VINEFAKCLFTEHDRENAISASDITSTLETAASDRSFVNEACQNSGKVVKSQMIYRKLKSNSKEDVRKSFRKQVVKIVKPLKRTGKSSKVSCDITEISYWGKLDKQENNMYLHNLTYEQKGTNYCYKFLTVSITCNNHRYVLDGIIVHRGMNIEDYVYDMIKFVKKHLSIEVVLFDRGFGWGVIHKMNQLNVNYMVFWKKQGKWYKEHFENMNDGDFYEMSKEGEYNRGFTNHKVKSKFVLIKQHEYKGKKFDWIFATNVDERSAGKYVMIYKKRWGIETIYRVTEDVRIYTTSTNPMIRYFLYMFTCFIYNVWKFFQLFLGKKFTLSNFKVNMIIYLFESGKIYPNYYDSFVEIASQLVRS